MTDRKIRRIGDILNSGQVERETLATGGLISKAEVEKTVDKKIDEAIARILSGAPRARQSLRRGFGFLDKGGEQ